MAKIAGYPDQKVRRRQSFSRIVKQACWKLRRWPGRYGWSSTVPFTGERFRDRFLDWMETTRAGRDRKVGREETDADYSERQAERIIKENGRAAQGR
jgi:hypothetical protein